MYAIEIICDTIYTKENSKNSDTFLFFKETNLVYSLFRVQRCYVCIG